MDFQSIDTYEKQTSSNIKPFTIQHSEEDEKFEKFYEEDEYSQEFEEVVSPIVNKEANLIVKEE